MKNITSKLLVALLGVGFLAGCGSSLVSSSISESSTSTSTTTSSETPSSTPSSSEDLGTPLSRGFDAEAVAHPGVVFYGNNTTTVTVNSAYEKDGVSTIRYTVTGGAHNDMKFFLENSGAETGKRYTTTFTVNAGVAFDGLVNGEAVSFMRGDNEIEWHFEETENASLTIVASQPEGTLVSNTLAFSDFTFTEKVYDLAEDIVIDGAIEDWIDIRAYERPLNLTGVTEDTDHKSVTFFGALTSEGLYVMAHAFHDILIDDDPDAWWQNTNFEFFVKGGDAQFWASANSTFLHENSTGIIVTTEYSGEANYESIAEVFVPTAKLPANAVVAGQIRVGFAWKTDGDQITGGEAAGGGYDSYWVPAGTWVNNADQTYVTYNGIFLDDQVNILPTLLTMDGNLADWATYAAYTTNKAQLVGTLATSHKDVTFYAMWTSEGLYLAAVAHHDVSITDAGNWWENTNFEVFTNGGTQWYIAANGAKAGGTGIIVTTASEGTANFVSVAELFIPGAYFPEGASQRVGFAWKTNGDLITGGAANGGNEDAYWVIPMHWPNNAGEQYYVTAEGIFETLPA